MDLAEISLDLLLVLLVAVPALGLVYLFEIFIWRVYFSNPYAKLPRAKDEGETWLLGMGPVMLREPPFIPNLRWALQNPSAPLVYFRFFCFDRVMVLDPDIMKEVFMDHYTYSKRLKPYEAVRMITGDGLVASDFEKHDRHRKMVSEAFHNKHLQSLVKVFSKQAGLLSDSWRGRDGQVVDLHDDVNKCTLNVIGLTAVAFDFDSFATEMTPGKEFGTTFLDMAHAHRDHLLHIIPFYKNLPTAANKKRKELRDKTHEVILSIIQAKRAHHQRIRETGKIPLINDILDILIQVRDESGLLTDQELAEETKTFVVAGNDTTGTLVVWCLYALSMNPDHYDRCVAEVDEVLGDREDVTGDDIKNMKYLSMCMKETMRMYPPVPLTPRHVERDVKLGGYDIPAGTILFLSSYILHHLPWLWENPEVFRPERFSKEESAGRHPHSYLPFIHGARNCIGQRFGLMEATVILAKTMQKYRFSVPDGFKLQTSTAITYRPEPKLRMVLNERKPRTEARAA